VQGELNMVQGGRLCAVYVCTQEAGGWQIASARAGTASVDVE